MNEKVKKGDIIIFKTEDGTTSLDVKLEEESVWLAQSQMANLFGKDRRTITEHIGNIFKEKELDKNLVCRKFQHTANDGKKYNTVFYNLDVIISVGYRVKSKQGTQFRIWATNTLKEHLIKGYTINEKRIRESEIKKLNELKERIDFIQRTTEFDKLSSAEAKGLLEIITQYTNSWILLNQYDSNELQIENLKTENVRSISFEDAKYSIEELKKDLIVKEEAGDLFGYEFNHGLNKILGAISQTFDGEELYKSIEEKAANLLYLIIKDHPFSDGNKRIGSFLFIMFLVKNNYLYKTNGERKFNDNALVALALLIAVSDPKDKDLLISLIVNFIKN